MFGASHNKVCVDLFTKICYTVNEDMKGGESDEQGGQGRINKQTFG
jgi:hypothetical protein